MIEQYIEESRYKEALELLTDKNDENVRYLRLVCLYGLQDLGEAKKEAFKAKDAATSSYYDVVSILITILKELGEYDRAIDILVEELSMPYIPEPYGSLLNTAYDTVLLEKQENIDLRNQTQTIFKEEELRLLLSKDTSQEVMVSVLEQLKSYNVRRLISEIKDYLKDPTKDSILKSILIEIMVEQEVDEEIEVYKNNNYIEVNPMYLPYVLESEGYEEISNLLVNAIEHENPSLLQLCIEYLEFFLYDFYPKEIYEMDMHLIAATIHYYVATLQSIPLDIEDLAFQYQVEKETILSTVYSLQELES